METQQVIKEKYGNNDHDIDHVVDTTQKKVPSSCKFLLRICISVLLAIFHFLLQRIFQVLFAIHYLMMHICLLSEFSPISLVINKSPFENPIDTQEWHFPFLFPSLNVVELMAHRTTVVQHGRKEDCQSTVIWCQAHAAKRNLLTVQGISFHTAHLMFTQM